METIQATSTNPVATFSDIRDAAERACVKASADKELKQKACFNAADLHCHDVWFCLDESGRQFWMVSIEEAAPDAYLLNQFIVDEMLKDGFGNVVVQLEW